MRFFSINELVLCEILKIIYFFNLAQPFSSLISGYLAFLLNFKMTADNHKIAKREGKGGKEEELEEEEERRSTTRGHEQKPPLHGN